MLISHTHQYLACALTLGQEVIADYTRELHHNNLLLNMQIDKKKQQIEYFFNFQRSKEH